MKLAITDTNYDENHLVAFLDILGFKSAINDHITGKDIEFLEKIDLALENAEYAIDKHLKQAKDSNYDLGMISKQFSDSMTVSFKHPIEEDKKDIDERLGFALQSLSEIQREMLKSEVYIRGGLSLGIFHRENNKRIFSEGLINSYKLKSKKALYPRIILHDNLLNILKDMHENHRKDMEILGVDKILVRDWDGVIFINPFNNFEVYENAMQGKRFKRRFKRRFNRPLLRNDLKILEKADKDLQLEILKNVEKKIKELKLKRETEINKDKIDNVLKKYYWLREFTKWNRNPKSSKIRFQTLKIEHLK